MAAPLWSSISADKTNKWLPSLFQFIDDKETLKTIYRPAQSGKWRKCHLRKFLDCSEICQHNHNETKEIFSFAADVEIFFFNSRHLGNLAVKIKTKQSDAFI